MTLVVWQVVPHIAISSIIGALVGSQIASYLSGNILRFIFVLFLFFVAARLLAANPTDDFNKTNIVDLKDKKIRLLLIGILSGFISGLTGLGGGIVAIPLMISLLNIPIKSVAGTSSSIMIFTALAATTGYILSGWNNPDLPNDAMGYVSFFTALPVLLGSVIFAQVGASLNNQISPNKLRYIFIFFLILMSLKTLFF
ncbi:MAG: sulfite exporter TauE/SafE family protein [Deltaproteobacteria bacterium]|nr:sulfite exporter TauE/SafE family protein [Deltaproteobacteria bacterium]